MVFLEYQGRKCRCQSARDPWNTPPQQVVSTRKHKATAAPDRPPTKVKVSAPEQQPSSDPPQSTVSVTSDPSYLKDQRPSTSDGRGIPMEVEVKVEMSWKSDGQFKTFEEKCAAFSEMKRDIFAPIANHTKVIREFGSQGAEGKMNGKGGEGRVVVMENGMKMKKTVTEIVIEGGSTQQQQCAAFAALHKHTPNFVPFVNHVMKEVSTKLKEMNIDSVEPVAAIFEKIEEMGGGGEKKKQGSPTNKKEQEGVKREAVNQVVCQLCKSGPIADDMKIPCTTGGWVHLRCANDHKLPKGVLGSSNITVVTKEQLKDLKKNDNTTANKGEM